MASGSGIPGFDKAAFETAIRSVMVMGAPETVEERATFRWTNPKSFAVADGNGSPYDFSDTPVTETVREDVQVTCAVEFTSRSTLSGGTGVATFNTPRAVITLLKDEHDLVEGANCVLLGGNTYEVDFVAPPIGLFDVTVYQWHCSAVDET